METGSDPFSDNEWELSKENVQPLKQGRKMANLTAALAPSSLDQTRIHREKQGFEAEIRTYNGDDPLDIWYRYIVWMSENFPKGGKDLGTLLERCITTFKDEERYRNDERYAKVWLRYTDICKDPMDIYNYMHSQQVCSGLTLFYESWALLLENLGDCKKADEVYNLGIYRNAQPLERLIKQHRAFEMRLAERISTGMQQVCLKEDSEPQRTMLGNLRPQGRKGSVGAKRTGHATLGAKGGIGTIPQIPSSTSSFKVFCDEDIGSKNSLHPSTGEWQFPPTETVIKRENTQKPAKWSNAKVSQRNQLSVPFSGVSQKPEFTVHVDDVATSHPPCTPQHVSQFDKVLSARKPEKAFVTEALKNKLQSDSEHTGGQKFKVMYCKEKIYTGTEEFSFEELRSARIFAQIRAGTYVKPVEEDQPANNVRYMYPKKEVYSFDGEFQWEEILAKRYFARLQRQKTLTNLHDSIQEAQSNSTLRGFAFVKQELCSDEQMEVVSCQKSAIRPTGKQENDARLKCHSSGIQSSTEPSVRRGLAFGDLPRTQLLSRDCSTAEREIPPQEQRDGARSAFQPFRNGQPLQSITELCFTRQENAATFQESRLHNLSSCYDVENAQAKLASRPIAAPASKPQVAPFGDKGSVHTQPRTSQAAMQVSKSKTETFCHTSDANRSGDLNSSHLSAPSPTVFTKQALEEVRNMFNGPLESERDETFWGEHQELDDSEKDFEAAFSNENAATNNKTISTGFPGFVIFEEPDLHAKSEEAEDKENKPPSGSQQEAAHRPLAGILQPSVGIPTCPLETHSEEEDELEEDQRVLDKENYPHEEAHKSCLAVQQQERVSEVSLAEYFPDHSLASFSFATAARVASTPFSNAIEPPTLPSIPWSTIRSTVDNNQASGDLAAVENACAQPCGSFMSTPSKVLSPILERSNEDSKSTNSSHSSAASSRRGSCSVGASLYRIQEETSACNTDNALTWVDQRTSELNPFSAKVIDEFLLKMRPPVSSYEGFSVSDKEMPRIAAHLTISLGNDDFYRVEKVVGSGAFAKVYMARKLQSELEVDDMEMDDDKAVVLKVQSDSVEWEFYICRQLHQRLRSMGCSEDLHAMFMNPPSAYLYSNSSVLVDRYNSMGTLLDMVNKYKLKQKSVDYYVAMHYTIALLRIVETMHAVGIIHGDIKPDNFIVLDSDADSPNVAPLKLIDFGRSIDMVLFPPGTTFTSSCRADDFQCIEVQEGKPWTTEIDTYGVLGTIHCILFGDYMKVFKEASRDRWKTIRSLKRNWDGLWSTMFDSLLNASVDGKQPAIAEFRQGFEEIYRMNEIVATKQKRRHDILMFA